MNTIQPVATGAYNPAITSAEAIAQLNDEMRRKPFGLGKRTVVTRAINHMGA